jgi:signal transduction histidine kinase
MILQTAGTEPAPPKAEPMDARWVASGLRMRVLLPLILGLILLVGALTTLNLLAREKQSQANAEDMAGAVRSELRERIELETRAMRAILDFLVAAPSLKNALRARDRQQLLALSRPLFDTMRSRNEISHMEFILPDRTALLRVQAPQEYGDRIDRPSLLRAEQTRATSWRNEPGPLGTSTLRVVHPWLDHGELIGYLELGIDLEDMMDELKATVGDDLFLAVDKSKLDRSTWEAARVDRPPAERSSWDEFPNLVLVIRTRAGLPLQLRSFLSGPPLGEQRHTFEAGQAGRVLQVVSTPFELGGSSVGQMVVMSDVTDVVAQHRRGVVTLVGLSCLVGGTLALFFYVLLGKVQRDVTARSARLEDARMRLAEERHDRLRAERELLLQQERNELLEARSRMVDELAAATRTAQTALRENEEITRKLRETQSELVATARQAGRAEIATNVLHNVGNVLNSVNTSAALVGATLRRSKLAGLSRALEMLEQHAGDAAHFLGHDDKGKLLPGYMVAAGRALGDEHRAMAQELERLAKSLAHIKDIVATQQSHATGAQVIEAVRPEDLADEAIRMQSSALARHQVTVLRDYQPMPVLPLDRGRVLQILVNLISNAKAAMSGIAKEARRLTLRVELAGASRLRFSVSDAGEGIPQENLTRIFVHGFTTRPGGHGFGLHSSALAAKELGGSLTVHSDGPGRGATFTLELPLSPDAH